MRFAKIYWLQKFMGFENKLEESMKKRIELDSFG